MLLLSDSELEEDEESLPDGPSESDGGIASAEADGGMVTIAVAAAGAGAATAGASTRWAFFALARASFLSSF